MSTLIVGDPHLQLQRLDDNKQFLANLLSLAQGHDKLILLGDLFHTFAVIRSEILSQWNEFFRTLNDISGLEVICLVGNHDYASQNGGSHALEVFNEYASIVSHPASLGGIHYAPFMRDDRAFEDMARALPAGSILICHQSFLGARFSSGFEDPHGADPTCVEHLKGVISGHIHTYQTLGNIWYPGTPYQNNFGEAGEEKRVFTIDLSPTGYSIEKAHDLGMPRYVMIQAESVSELRLPEPDTRTSYKIMAKGGPAEIAAFWSDPKVKEFRSKARRVVDAMTPDRGAIVMPGSNATTKKEKLDEYIRSKKWRTPTDQLMRSAADLLFEVQ